jgi:HEPN pEK499 p136
MSSIKNYKIDFVKRTKELLQDNFDDFIEKDKEVTFLLNCLLGLIITVSENEKKTNLAFQGLIDDDFLSFIPEKVGFFIKGQHKQDLTQTDLTNLQTRVGHKTELKECKKLWFINKLRNGIAHQNIEGINDKNIWVGLRLWNTYNDVKDFEIVFTIEELKKLSIKIVDEYLSLRL